MLRDSNAERRKIQQSAWPVTILYLVCAVSLGTVAGAAVAVLPWHFPSKGHSLQVQPAASKPAQTAAAGVTQPVKAVQAGKLTTSAEPAKQVKAGRSVKVDQPTSSAHSRHRHGKGLLRVRAKKHVSRHRAHVTLAALHDAPVGIPGVSKPSAAKPEVQDSAFRFTMEGDGTVVDYDAENGVIFTHEGATFVLGKANGAERPDTSRGFPAHLHYFCDQASDCTLAWSGFVFAHAHLTPQML